MIVILVCVTCPLVTILIIVLSCCYCKNCPLYKSCRKGQGAVHHQIPNNESQSPHVKGETDFEKKGSSDSLDGKKEANNNDSEKPIINKD